MIRYRVYFTPILNIDAMTYDDEIDVSDRITVDGIGSIKKSIDSSDYDIGIYTYGDLELTGANHNGYFNESGDTRSIFQSTRDRCKVRVVYTEADSDGVETEFVSYQGLLNEEASRIDAVTETIRFKVLSLDSVIRNTKVSGGTIPNNTLCSTAIESILNVPSITAVLGFDAADINPDYDFTIDDGSQFDNKSTREVLNQLLLASNSIMLLDSDNNMIVRDRLQDETKDVLTLYGKSDLYSRENIIRITSFNAGKHRMFTSIKVNDTESEDADLSATFGYRQRKLTLDFITASATEESIADNLLTEFAVPKMEMNVQVSMSIAKEVELMDRVSVDYPLRVKPIAGTFLPVVGVTAIDDAAMPLPDIFGSFSMNPNMAWKVIEINDNPKEFTSVLKLRQIGNTLSDGIFNAEGTCGIVGTAIIDNNIVCTGGTDCDKYNPAIVGGAVIDCSEAA